MNYTIPSSHPDLIILCKHTETETSNLGPSSHGGNEPYDCNYMRTYNFRYWSFDDVIQLSANIDKANLETAEYRFELVDTENYEVEYDNDRSYPASFTFKSHKK
jgi:hypothetical protein